MAPAFLCAELLLKKLQSTKALERKMCGNGPKTECESPVPIKGSFYDIFQGFAKITFVNNKLNILTN